MPAPILIVDDDLDTVTLLRTVLRDHPCRHARDGETALSLVQAERPALVILDIMLDGIHGFHVLERIRSDPKTADLPVVLCSCVADEALLQRAKALGVSDVIEKPFDPVEASARLRKLLKS